jgi:formamidopyrimidine-DNA glycosylase
MPELPDLEYVSARLREELIGREITAARVKEPIVLRIAVPGDLSACVGSAFTSVERRGQFLVFGLTRDLKLVINAMLAGRLRVAPASEKSDRGFCFALGLSGSQPGETRELRYLDDKRMGKVYLIRAEDEAKAPGLLDLGVDILSDAFTLDHFRALARKRRDQIRVFLMDKSAISAIGNAYADEILFDAGIHPKTWTRQLSQEELAQLYKSILAVMRAAIREVAEREAPTEEKIRDFLKVRNRKGEPCPKCGEKIRSAIVSGADSYFCPHCQPASRKLFIDWSHKPGDKG